MKVVILILITFIYINLYCICLNKTHNVKEKPSVCIKYICVTILISKRTI